MFLFIYLFCLLKAGGAEATFFLRRDKQRARVVLMARLCGFGDF